MKTVPMAVATATVLLFTLTTTPVLAKPMVSKVAQPKVNSQNFIKWNCTTPDGHRLTPGQDHVMHGQRNCTIFQCTRQGMTTLVSDCVAPRCVLPTRKAGACCLTCPRGFNCRLPNGDEMDHNDVYDDGGMRCTCPKIRRGLGWEQDLVNAECYPITSTLPPTTTPPPNCQMDDGKELRFGEVQLEPIEEKVKEEKEKDDKEEEEEDTNGCIRYECGLSGKMDVQVGDCEEPKCENPVRQPGACCKTCPGDATSAISDPVTYRTTPTPEHNKTGNGTVIVVSVQTFFKMLLYSFFGIPFELVEHSTPHNHTTHEIKAGTPAGGKHGVFQQNTNHHKHHGGGHHHHHHHHHNHRQYGRGGYQQQMGGGQWWQG